MNPNIILAGRQPDFVNVLRQSTAGAQEANQVRSQNALRQLYQQQGPQIMAGDPNAMNALAQHDPMQAQQMQAQRAQMDRQAQAWKMRVSEYARGLKAEEAAAEARQIESGIKRAFVAFQGGDLAGVNAILQQAGEQPIQSLEQFPAVVSRYGDALTTLKEVAEFGRKKAGTEGEREIERLESIGIPREQAIKIKEGVLRVVTDPTTGRHTILDVATGAAVGQAQDEPQAATEPSADFGQPYSASETAFGLEGMARRGVNAVSDAVGAGAIYPETQDTQSDFGILSEQLVNDVAAGYKRQPPSWLLKNIAELVPRAGTVEGPDKAKSKLRSIGRNLSDELRNVQRQLQRPMREQARQELEAKVSALAAAVNRVDMALMSFEKSGGGQKTKSGVSWSVVE